MARGKEFTDRLFGLRKRAATGEHEFDKLCTELSIEHRLTPPKSPQTNGMVERFNGRIEEVLQSHHFRSGEELETTLHRYVWLYNQQLPQSALGSKSPLQAMKDWHKLKPQLFRKQPYYLPGCDIYGKYELPVLQPDSCLRVLVIIPFSLKSFTSRTASFGLTTSPRMSELVKEQAMRCLRLCLVMRRHR